MSKQDDLLNQDADLEQGEETANSDLVDDAEVGENPEPRESQDSTAEGLDEVVSAREEVQEDIAGRGIAAGEIRVVEPPSKRSSSSLPLSLLLLAVLFGGGYYLLSGSFSGPLLFVDSVENTAPKRYAIDKQVTVETVSQQEVAAVKTTKVTAAVKPVVAVASTEAAELEKPLATSEKTTAKQPVKAEKKASAVSPSREKTVAATAPQFHVLVGPYLNKAALEKAAEQLQKLGYDTATTKGRGYVSMTRLLEGVYPREEARERLAVVKKSVGDAFMLQTGDKWAIYVGSFSSMSRAEEYVAQLAEKGVNVVPISSDVELSGKMLIAAQGHQQYVKEAAEKITAVGLRAQVQKK